MRRCRKHLVGLICIAVGLSIILSLVLPNWLWMSCFATVLIITGCVCFK
ncbi:MAG: 2-oxoglutarate translocator [Tepidibacter sp.]|nr:2-oxoglutarate translocator [Tepidibacter sp.]MCT4508204.1 2-oxoglutarate translocator [Tepidibacter sp.]